MDTLEDFDVPFQLDLAKLQYFTNLGFPEIGGFPLLKTTIWGEMSRFPPVS